MKYEVIVTAYRTVLVDAESPDQAAEIAQEECYGSGGWEIESYEVGDILRNDSQIRTAIMSGAVELDDW